MTTFPPIRSRRVGRAVPVVLAAALILGLGACDRPASSPPTSAPSPTTSALATPSAPTDPQPGPALTRAQAQAFVDQLNSVMKKADKKQSGTLAASVLTGHELTVTKALYAFTKDIGVRRTWAPVKLKVSSVTSSAAEQFPQQALIVSSYPKTNKYVALWDVTRSSADDDWRLRTSGFSGVKRVNTLLKRVSAIGVPVADSEPIPGLKLTPAELSPTLTTALRAGGSANDRRFVKDPYPLFYKGKAGPTEVSKKTISFASAEPSAVWPVTADTSIALVPGRHTDRERMNRGAWLSFGPKDQYHQRYPKRYTRQAQSAYDSYLVVLTKGKLDVREPSTRYVTLELS